MRPYYYKNLNARKKTTTEVFVIKRANISTAEKKGATYLGKAAGSYVRGRTSVNRHRIYEEEDQKLRSQSFP